MKRIGQFFFTFIPLLLTWGLQLAVMFLMMILSAITWLVAGRDLFFLPDLWSTNAFSTWLMIFYSISCIAIFGLWYYMRYNANYMPDVKRTFHPLTFVGILMLAPGLQYMSTYIVAFVSVLFPHALENYMSLLETAGLDSSISLSMLIYSVILAPISEELTFRGITMSHAKKFLPFWMANFFQAVLFGVFHLNLMQGIYAFFLGLFLGYVCEKGGNLYHSILLHMVFNFFGTVLSQFLSIGESAFSILFWFLFAIVMCAGGIAVFRAGTARAQGNQQTDAFY
jgi:hypothetical protein